MKHMDVCYNEIDFRQLLDHIQSFSGYEYALKGRKIIRTLNDSALDEQRIIITLQPIDLHQEFNEGLLEQLDCIFVEKMTFTDNSMYHPGGISCYSTNPKVISLYQKVSKFIKSNYIKTYDASYFIGPELYRNWKNHKVEFHFFVDAFSFTVDGLCFDLQRFIATFAALGYTIEENWHDIRKPESVFQGNEFVIHYPNAKTHTKLISRRKFFFPDSECVFLWKEEQKKPCWRFIVDARHFERLSEFPVDKDLEKESFLQLWNQCLSLVKCTQHSLQIKSPYHASVVPR